MECHYKFENMLLQYTRTLFDKNEILGDTKKPSGRFDHLQISCSCGDGIDCAKLEKLITKLSSPYAKMHLLCSANLWTHALGTANICQVSPLP